MYCLFLSSAQLIEIDVLFFRFIYALVLSKCNFFVLLVLPLEAFARSFLPFLEVLWSDEAELECAPDLGFDSRSCGAILCYSSFRFPTSF